MTKLYRIGLDIGIGSVGYSVIENDPITEEPVRIIKLGVRTFSPNEVDKTGESSAKKRRESRGVRRRKRRKQFRFERTKKLLERTFGNEIWKDLEILNFGDKERKIKPTDVYELRAKALEEKLSNAEIAKIVLHILKHRGFKSNRKNQQSNNDEGKLLSSINENLKYFQEKGYRSIGEMLYKDEKYKVISSGREIYNVRNHSGDYSNCFYREDLKNELILILKTQQQLGNIKLTDEIIEKLISIFESQRNFDEGPGEGSPYSAKFEVGDCTFIKTEKRAPKASYTFELFNSLSKINNLKVNGEELTLDQKQFLYEFIKEKEKLKFSDVRKLLKIESGLFFNLCSYKLSKKDDDLSQEDYIKKCENQIFVSMKNSFEIKKKLGLELSYENRDLLDEVALMLSLCKSDSTIDDYISKNEALKQLSSVQIEEIKNLNFDKFGSLSIKAMKKVEPFLLQGQRYDKACKSAGFNHSSFEHEKLKFVKGKEVDEVLADITNNVVKRSVNQTLRILNEIIKEYGSPQFISIELARDLGLSKTDRNKIEKNQQARFLDNEKIVQILINEFKITKPKGQDILKYKLYLEQNGKCMYSGKPIDDARLFEPNYLQIDHILPFSKSMNDSFNNKVLVISGENQNKGDRTPYEYFGSDANKWNEFVARVSLLKNREKQRNLLKQTITDDDQNEFISRNINDTRYMSKLLFELFRDYLQMTPVKEKEGKKRKVVYSVNGAVTSYLRKCWGIDKIREDGDIHHCIDATIIAMVNDGMIQKITKFNKFKEKFETHGDKFISKITGEVLSAEEKQEYEKENISVLSGRLPMPYDWFLKELKIRSRVNYLSNEFSDEEKFELSKLGYSPEEIAEAKPVFVSRMKTVKTTGPIHKETLMSAREYKETGNLIKSVSIYNLSYSNKVETTKLKDDKYPEFSIENYYRPKDDRLLYLALKECLIENGGKIPQTKVFHKPRKDGTDGPVVKTVKMYEKASKCVITPNGAAANDTMYRVDVFKKDGKYYFCPIYMADVYAHKLPNKLVVANSDWLTIDKTYNFLFSVFKNDIIKISNNKDLTLKKKFNSEKSNKDEIIKNKEFLLYYKGINISTGALDFDSYDNCYFVTIGGKTLLNLEKYYVDIMGNVYKAPKEERKPI